LGTTGFSLKQLLLLFLFNWPTFLELIQVGHILKGEPLEIAAAGVSGKWLLKWLFVLYTYIMQLTLFVNTRPSLCQHTPLIRLRHMAL